MGHRVVQVACGSRDAQTLALTDKGLVFSWGDGDFGKLGESRVMIPLSDGTAGRPACELLSSERICAIGALFA